MKLNLLANILTGVLILMFTSLSLGQETQEACIAKKARVLKAKCATLTVETEKNSCRLNADADAKEDAECMGLLSGADKKDAAKKCEDSKKDYYEKSAKEKEACRGFTQERDNDGKPLSCSQKYTNCQAQMGGLFDDGKNVTNGSSYLMQFAQQMAVSKLTGSNTSAAASTAVPNCIDDFDPKAVRDAAKELAREKKDLEKEIKKEREEQIKLGKARTEKQDKIKKETAELEAENKKAGLEKEKRMSEETAKIAKNGVEIAKRVRMYTIAINKKSQELAKNNFEYQTALLEFTDAKVTAQCKQQFNALKAAIIQSKGKIPAANGPALTAEEKAKNESVAAVLGSGTGIQATQNAAVVLNNAKAACFEKANTTKQKNMLANSQAVANINSDMEELKKNIADEKAQLATDQKQIKTLQDQSDKAKNQEETEKLEKLANLNSELTNFIASNQQEIDLSQEQQKKLTSDIQALVLKTNFDAKPAMSEAEKAITTARSARSKANTDCCSDPKEKEFCDSLKTSISEEKKAKTPQKPESAYPTGEEKQAN